MPSTVNEQNIKIAHVASGDLWAGAEAQLFTLAKTSILNKSADLYVILLNHGELEKRLEGIGIRTFVIDESQFSFFQIFYRILVIFKQIKPDIVHTHRRKENILGSFAAFYFHNVPSIRTAHGNPPRPALYEFSRWLVRQLDLISGRFLQQYTVAVSCDLANILGNELPKNKIMVIENGLDLGTVGNDICVTNSFPKNGASLKIGIACRLVPVKRVDLFIRTAHYMKHNLPGLPTSFHIYGDGPLRSQLETLSNQLNMDTIVHFEGHVDGVQKEIMTLDALVITSDHEGLPMVLLEAMALGIPVVAHEIGGIPNVLHDGSCGILVSKHNPSGYANAVHDLATSTQSRINIINNASERVKKYYTAEINAHNYFSLYSRLIK